MKISYRHSKRLKHVVARDGPKGLVHGNTGRRPANAIGLELRQKIVALSHTEYAFFNDTHFTEKLATEHGIRIGRETARKIHKEVTIFPGCAGGLNGINLVKSPLPGGDYGSFSSPRRRH